MKTSSKEQPIKSVSGGLWVFWWVSAGVMGVFATFNVMPFEPAMICIGLAVLNMVGIKYPS